MRNNRGVSSLEQTVFDGLMKVVIYSASLLLLLLAVLVFCQVIMRYVFLKPIRWADLLVRVLFAYSGMLGMVVAVHKNQDARLSFLADRLKPVRRQQLEMLVCILSLILVIVLLSPTGQVLRTASRTRLPVLPLGWHQVLASFPLAMVLLAIVYLRRILYYSRRLAGLKTNEQRREVS